MSEMGPPAPAASEPALLVAYIFVAWGMATEGPYFRRTLERVG